MDDEQDWLTKARELDQTALAAIFDAHYDAINRYLMFHTGHRETAEDLSAQVFHRLLDALRAGKGPERYLKAWLFRVARNLIVDEARRGQHRDHLPLDETLAASGALLEDAVQQRILIGELGAALDDLTESQRSVIILRYLINLSNEETAQIMELTVGAVKAQQHRALASLRQSLRRKFNEEGIYE